MIGEGRISGRMGKEVYAEMVRSGKGAAEIVAERGYELLDDAEVLEEVVERVLAANPEEVGRYRAGKTGLLQFFVGQVMRETEGRADPERVNELLKKRLCISQADPPSC
jgi:Asp-tRNA(Asn)/Glu-tRNA(Gln) amidotransferase B subunit